MQQLLCDILKQQELPLVDFHQLDSGSAPERLLLHIPWFLCAQGIPGNPVSHSHREVHVHPVAQKGKHRGQGLTAKHVSSANCTYQQVQEVAWKHRTKLRIRF